jgi:hypothetical protein
MSDRDELELHTGVSQRMVLHTSVGDTEVDFTIRIIGDKD